MKKILIFIVMLLSASSVFPQSKGTVLKQVIQKAKTFIIKKSAASGTKLSRKAGMKTAINYAAKASKSQRKLPEGVPEPKNLPPYLSQRRWRHIMINHGDKECAIRHFQEGGGKHDATYFTEGFRDKIISEIPQITKVENVLYKTKAKGKRLQRFVYQKHYSEPIGFDLHGNALYDCKVVTSEDGKRVITAYPVVPDNGKDAYLKRLLKKAKRDIPN